MAESAQEKATREALERLDRAPSPQDADGWLARIEDIHAAQNARAIALARRS